MFKIMVMRFFCSGRKVRWKYFYDINLVNKNYRPFDASNWPLQESGLFGPVRMQAIKKMGFETERDL